MALDRNVYSNQVFLISTSRARYTKEDSFATIDLKDMDTYSHVLDRDKYLSVRSRLFKIIDVKRFKDNELKENPYPMGVLIENLQTKEKVICRVSDLLFTNLRFISIRYVETINSLHARYVLFREYSEKAYSNRRELIDYIIDNRIYRRRFTRHSSLHKELTIAYECSQIVDNNDSRALNRSYERFYLKKQILPILEYIIDSEPREHEAYHSCRYCNLIDANLTGFDVHRICNSCYSKVEDECGVCYGNYSLDMLKSTKRLSNSKKKSILESIDAELCCTICWDMFYKSCDRCKKTEIIDLEVLRNSSYREKTRILDSFMNNFREYKYVMQELYCIDCATFRINSFLYNPFRLSRLPDEYPVKTEFNRFIGIESEVISEYVDVDEYYNDQPMPDLFKVVEDGSLNEGGVEFVTERPIIGQQVNQALDSLEEHHVGAWNSVDDSCGIHIHFNAIDFGFKELKSLLMIMSKIQRPIYDGLPRNRQDSRYCKFINYSSRDWAMIDNLPTLVDSYYRLEDSMLNDSKYNEARYLGTNLHARFYLGTIEFRYHEGSTKSKPIEHWIRFLNTIMDVSKKLHKKPKLYSKIISMKTQPIDVVRDISGVWGAEYIEGRIDNNN